MIQFQNSFLSLRLDFFSVLFCTRIFQLGDKIAPKKSPKDLLKNQSEFVRYNFIKKKEVSQMKSHTIFRPLNFLRQRLMMIQRFLSLSLYDDYYCHCQHCLLPRLHYLALPLRWFCKGKFGDLVNMGYYLQLTIRKPS